MIKASTLQCLISKLLNTKKERTDNLQEAIHFNLLSRTSKVKNNKEYLNISKDMKIFYMNGQVIQLKLYISTPR